MESAGAFSPEAAACQKFTAAAAMEGGRALGTATGPGPEPESPAACGAGEGGASGAAAPRPLLAALAQKLPARACAGSFLIVMLGTNFTSGELASGGGALPCIACNAQIES